MKLLYMMKDNNLYWEVLLPVHLTLFLWKGLHIIHKEKHEGNC